MLNTFFQPVMRAHLCAHGALDNLCLSFHSCAQKGNILENHVMLLFFFETSVGLEPVFFSLEESFSE